MLQSAFVWTLLLYYHYCKIVHDVYVVVVQDTVYGLAVLFVDDEAKKIESLQEFGKSLNIQVGCAILLTAFSLLMLSLYQISNVVCLYSPLLLFICNAV